MNSVLSSAEKMDALIDYLNQMPFPFYMMRRHTPPCNLSHAILSPSFEMCPLNDTPTLKVVMVMWTTKKFSELTAVEIEERVSNSENRVLKRFWVESRFSVSRRKREVGMSRSMVEDVFPTHAANEWNRWMDEKVNHGCPLIVVKGLSIFSFSNPRGKITDAVDEVFVHEFSVLRGGEGRWVEYKKKTNFRCKVVDEVE